MVAHKQKIKKKHKQHGRIIAARTSALTKSPLSTKTKFLLELICPTAQNNAMHYCLSFSIRSRMYVCRLFFFLAQNDKNKKLRPKKLSFSSATTNKSAAIAMATRDQL